MQILDIKKIELEITSDCNAACPGCARTPNKDKLQITSFGLADLERIFPTREHIDKKIFKFCGVLGDPAMNVECLPMVEYLTSNGGWCQLSTNGGVQKAEWWAALGKLSAETKLVDVSFCVDGHRETNHIYRINTKFDVIERNMQAYADGGSGQSSASWIFIVFDHNEYELDSAKEHAERLGFRFATRTGMRNSYHNWVSAVKVKNPETKKLEEKVSVITTSTSNEHKEKEAVLSIDKAIHNLQNVTAKVAVNKTDAIEVKRAIEQVKQIANTISCKFVHEGEIFIAADQRLWPCCFLWDSSFLNKEKINDKLSIYGGDWNNLKVHTLDEILAHPWFSQMLAESWDPTHNLHLTRCLKTCGLNKSYQNKIVYTQ